MLAAQGQGMHGHQDISWIPSLWSVVGDLYYLYGEHSKWSGISSDQAVTCFDVFMAICGPTGLLHFGEKIIFLLWWNCFALWFPFAFSVCIWVMTLALPSPLVLHTKESHGTQIFFLLNSISKKGRIWKLQICVGVKDIFTSLKECYLARLQNPIQCTEGSDVGVRGKGGLFCRLGWGVPYPPRPRAPTGRRDRGVTKSSIPEPPSLPTSSLSPNF